VRIFHSAISRSFASAVLTHFIPATTLTQAVLEVTVADLVCENVDHDLEELQVSLT